MIIRRANVKDFDAVLDLANQLYETECPFDNNLKKDFYETEKAQKRILKSIRARKKVFLVAEENQKVVGFANGYIEKHDCYTEKVGYLDELCVDENFRKQGIGKLLIDEFSKKMKEQGAKFIKLNAFRKNLPAVSLYKKEGFTEYSVYYQRKL